MHDSTCDAGTASVGTQTAFRYVAMHAHEYVASVLSPRTQPSYPSRQVSARDMVGPATRATGLVTGGLATGPMPSDPAVPHAPTMDAIHAS